MLVRIAVGCGAVIGMIIMWVIVIRYLTNAEKRLQNLVDELKKEED